MKNFHSGLKEICGPITSDSSPLLNTDGTTLITDKDDILKRWAEHFDSVLNRPSVINDEVINRLPQIPTNEALVDTIPTREELLKASSQLSSDKAPGSDNIPAEVYKTVAQLLSFESYSCLNSSGNRKQFLRTSRMPPSSL